jgi:hypothetical protein
MMAFKVMKSPRDPGTVASAADRQQSLTGPRPTHRLLFLPDRIFLGLIVGKPRNQLKTITSRIVDISAGRAAVPGLVLEMRLINTTTLTLEEFGGLGNKTPAYAILSHTWGDQELSLQEWIHPSRSTIEKQGYNKILSACAVALASGFTHVWIDTTCIDKTSSAELSEAINSMFSWYRDAEICYAYLADVSAPVPTTLEANGGEENVIGLGTRTRSWLDDFGECRWFTRGWTLQELVAPKKLHFYCKDWSYLGNKTQLARELSDITSIAAEYLIWPGEPECLPPWTHTSLAERMSWLSRRDTGRVEDMAYCMLGIFGINMSLLYGEGWNAFFRLQEELIKSFNDHTLFCWTSSWDTARLNQSIADPGFLAPSPSVFYRDRRAARLSHEPNLRPLSPCFITNVGVSITLPLLRTWNHFIGMVNVKMGKDDVGISLAGDMATRSFRRRKAPLPPIPLSQQSRDDSVLFELFIQTKSLPRMPQGSFQQQYTGSNSRSGFLLTFGCRDELCSIETFPMGSFIPEQSIVLPRNVGHSDSLLPSARATVREGQCHRTSAGVLMHLRGWGGFSKCLFLCITLSNSPNGTTMYFNHIRLKSSFWSETRDFRAALFRLEMAIASTQYADGGVKAGPSTLKPGLDVHLASHSFFSPPCRELRHTHISVRRGLDSQQEVSS